MAVAVDPLATTTASCHLPLASRNQLSLTAFNLVGICAALMDLCRLMLQVAVAVAGREGRSQ